MQVIADWAGEGFDADAVETKFKEAFSVEEGEELPEEHSAIVMVMHTEASSGDTHALVVIPVGKLMGDVQTEVDTIEESVGLESDGTFKNEAEGVSKDAETIKDAIKAIDDNLGVKSEGTTISADTVWAAIEEVATEKTAVVADETNLNITVESADVEGKVTYTIGESGLTPEESGVVISDEATVASNLTALDTKIGEFVPSPEYAEEFSAATENAIETDDTVGTGLAKLDNKVKALVDEVLANEEVSAQAIHALATAAGVTDGDGNIAYQIHEDDTILSGASDLDSADVALADAIRDLEATAGSLEGKEAIAVAPKGGEGADKDALQVSLTLDTEKDATEGSAKIDLTQSEDGLFAEVALDNTASVEPAEGETVNGGIGLTQNENGVVKATLYWGTF